VAPPRDGRGDRRGGAPPDQARARWPWALAFVGALHLLTTAGTWLVSDHAELLFMSRQLVTRGTLTLAPPGQRVADLPWIVPAREGPTRSRLFPGTAVAMAPLVALDRLMGWDDPRDFGRAAHLGGHLYLLGALAFLGAAVRASGASPQAAAVAVVLAGTAWPLWQISRHGGAEPVVAFLLAVFLWGHVRTSRRVEALACSLLPWVHPTGCLLAPMLALSEIVETGGGEAASEAPRRRVARAARLLVISLLSIAALILIWNGLYHGNWWGGGYANQGADQGFFASRAWPVLTQYLRDGLLLGPLPLIFAFIGALARGRGGWREIVTPAALLAAYLALFAVFSTPTGQEPARRLSVVYLAFALVAGRTWDRLSLRGVVPLGIVLMSSAIGAYWFLLRESNYYRRPDGGYDPLVLWLTLAREGRPAWQYLLPVIGLCALLLASLAGIARLDAGRGMAVPERRSP